MTDPRQLLDRIDVLIDDARKSLNALDSTGVADHAGDLREIAARLAWATTWFANTIETIAAERDPLPREQVAP